MYHLLLWRHMASWVHNVKIDLPGIGDKAMSLGNGVLLGHHSVEVGDRFATLDEPVQEVVEEAAKHKDICT